MSSGKPDFITSSESRMTFAIAKQFGKQETLLRMILAEIRLLASSSRSNTPPTSATSSKEVPCIKMDMRSWQKVFDFGTTIFEYIIPLLRYLGPWAWLIITWMSAMIVAAWKGVIPWFGL